mmetsp:Transcript_2918/g.4607  ORF Transcript_2918/g.4607 Transcript_2918/m.4607 type:complete len:1035 (+) Transcript_2918:148-3252(+)|eukprot:CAMPEP_0196805540 /NCGR_PEP_ID=MMETSP1362-20130617/5332_1 /TAXON_ID=163516 /ORGANISM="Leptocylindrus danicus, Strain CCMP1856" /LENGTH=1034 /DNA_ID=CAMNT_0042178549 /DNA_START=116 /DNA_END=3220 /DNA_ORIENTATION=+
MSGTASAEQKKRIAIIGGGCSGLACAWHLLENNSDYDVHLYEQSFKLGGHANTVHIDKSNIDVDIGFMVFNDDNYPNMTAWFNALNVQSEASDMSLSVSLDRGKTVEWCSSSLAGMCANPLQVFRPGFYKFIAEMMRFNRDAAKILVLSKDDPNRVVTTAQYLRQNGYSEEFCSYYLLPMMAALWSASIEDVLQFPAEQLIGFLCNHKMLQVFDRPYWKTVAGRSKSYTLKMAEILGDRAHLSCPITRVQQSHMNGSINRMMYELFTSDDESVGIFDEVVFACAPPIAAKMLTLSDYGTNTNAEQLCEILNKVQYEDNAIYVHSDPELMPQSKAAWASWNCLGKAELLSTHKTASSKNTGSFEGGESGFGNRANDDGDTTVSKLDGEDGRMRAVYVTYYLNKLQNLETDDDIFVSLNPHSAPKESCVHHKVIMAHPQFTPQTLCARETLEVQYQGKDGLWFCGAWGGYGFHEDGCRSGFKVATAISKTPLPWVTSQKNNAEQQDLVLPPPDLAQATIARSSPGLLGNIYHTFTYTIPIALCKRIIRIFLNKAITKGRLEFRLNDGSVYSFGDGSKCGCDDSAVSVRVFDDWFFVKVAMEYDLGLARSYMSGHFIIEPLSDKSLYDPVIRPPNSREESNVVLGDPIGLTRLFLLFIGNRDAADLFAPSKSAIGHTYSNALTNASGLVVSKLGSFLNFLRYKLTMDNSERGGSLKNIHAHYDLSNDLFTTFLDKETLMYSSAIYDAVKAPSGRSGLVFRGTLEEAQWRKLDTLLDRAQVQPGQRLLDIGFGWGGLSLHAAKKYGCEVTGITLSVEQKALAEERVKKAGLEHLITFEVVDYRKFARRKENRGKFDRVLSCEMIEAVGHEHLGEFFWAVEQVLAYDGILVMEAITTPETRYETYRRSTDFINTIIFPGSCCPSLHALVDASYKQSSLTLEHIDNIGLHYAQTLAEWRRRFNASESFVRKLGFDDVFMRVWNYYLTYCEAGFHSQTENCLILVFSRQGCNGLVPLCETKSVTQLPTLTDDEINAWISGA